VKLDILEMSFPGEGDWALIVARGGDVLLGSVALRRSGPAGEFARLFVVPSHRRNGVGRELLAAAEAIARHAGCVALSCSVNPKNLHAKLFYSRIGFRPAFQFGDGDLLYSRPIAPLPVAQAGEMEVRCDRCDPSFTCWSHGDGCRHPEAREVA